MTSKTDFVRGVRPCIVGLWIDADDGNTFWDYLNTKSPQHPLCFSVFQADAKDAVTISDGRAFLHFGFTSNHDGTVSRHEFDMPKEITFVINFANSEALQEFAVGLPCPRSGSVRKVDEDAEPVVFGFDSVLSPEGPVCVYDSSLDTLSANISEGQCSYELLCGMYNHILNRSYDYMLKERTVVVVGVGCYSKLPILKYLASVGAHTVLLDEDSPPPWASSFVQHFIESPLYDAARYEESAKKAAMELKELNMKLFSVVTLYEDFVPFRATLTAILQQEGLLTSKNRTISVENALRNKDKIEVYESIRRCESPHLDSSQHSIAPNTIILTDENVSTIQIKCPHILKLSTSCGAFGCMRINTTKDIVPAYKSAKKLITETPNRHGAGMCFEQRVFMSELYEGGEHEVDIVMRNGEPVFHLFSDKLPVSAGEDISGTQFLEKGCVMPSKIIKGPEAQQYLTAIVHALKNLNLTHGVFNADFISTPHGIKIIDVNPRPGGYYLDEWINTATGVSIIVAEVILRSELEYFVQPLVVTRSIAGYNVFSKKQLAGDLARYSNMPNKDVRVYYVQGPNDELDPTEVYASIYEVTDLAVPQ